MWYAESQDFLKDRAVNHIKSVWKIRKMVTQWGLLDIIIKIQLLSKNSKVEETETQSLWLEE